MFDVTIKEKIEKQFYNDLNELNIKFDVNNCFFIDIDNIKSSLIYTFNFLMNNLNNYNDLINYFTIETNKKIKCGFSIKPYVLCDNMINNNCKISKKCYASKNELFFKYDANNNKRYYSIEKTLKNYIFYHYCIFSNIDYNIIILDALKLNEKTLNKNDIIRFNIKSDFINNKHLYFCNNLFELLIKHYNYKYAYSYTKTKNLNYKDLNNNFIINKSIILNDINELKTINLNDASYKYITILNKDANITNIKNINVCNNYIDNNIKCINCKQCINKKNKINLIH